MKVTLLDGGMGQELIRRAAEPPTPLWATEVMRRHPGLVAAVHRDYFDAGATVATTNTYAIHRDRLAPVGLEESFGELLAAALSEVSDVRREGKVAGSIGPLIASYRPDIHPDPETAIPLYREVAEALAPHVDLLLCETVASVDHARSILAATVPLGLPVWLAVTVDDTDGTRLRSGETVSDIAQIGQGEGAAALLANCSAPEAMPAALDALRPGGLPLGAYGNAFTRITSDFLKDRPTVDALTARRDMGPAAYADHALAWLDHGATILGGCCETGPAHIAAIARRLREAGHEIV